MEKYRICIECGGDFLLHNGVGMECPFPDIDNYYNKSVSELRKNEWISTSMVMNLFRTVDHPFSFTAAWCIVRRMELNFIVERRDNDHTAARYLIGQSK